MSVVATFTTTNVLSNEEFVKLHNEYKNGSNGAFDTLVESNTRLVLKIAHDFKNYGMDFEDIVSNGTIGLMKAIENFDATKGVFSPYASLYIKKYIRMGFEKCRAIHTKRYDRMTQEEHGAYIVESLNEKIGDGNTEFADALYDDALTPTEQLEKEEHETMLMQALETLSDKEQYIVLNHNGIGGSQTLQEISQKLNCSTERVRQIEAEAFEKMRKFVRR